MSTLHPRSLYIYAYTAYNEAKGLIMAFRSKGSKKYGPTGTGSFYGKGEGAKETLGMISI